MPSISSWAIPTSLGDAQEDIEELKKELEIDDGWIRFDAQNQRIELPLSVAEEIATVLQVPVQLVEVHPTHDRLEVGIVNLNSHRWKLVVILLTSDLIH